MSIFSDWDKSNGIKGTPVTCHLTCYVIYRHEARLPHVRTSALVFITSALVFIGMVRVRLVSETKVCNLMASKIVDPFT